MQFETQRLIIREWCPSEDARHAMDIYGDARVMHWLEAGSQDGSVLEVQRRLQGYVARRGQTQNNSRNWAVVQKDIGRVIGSVVISALPDMKDIQGSRTFEPVEHELTGSKVFRDGLSADYVELGWYFRPASWGFGYATEAAFQVARYGFETLDVSLLLAVVSPENTRAVAVAEGLGMRCDGLTTRRFRGEALWLYLLRAPALESAEKRWRSRFEV